MNWDWEEMLTGGKAGMRLSMKEKRRQAAALQSGPPQKAGPTQGGEKHRSKDRPLQMRAGDEKFQGAGDDFEFDGEAGEGFAVDLGVERIFVERLADDGVSFVEMDALSAAETAHPEGGQVAQIAEAALRGEGHDFELIFEEIGVGGDFEGAAVIFGAADDDQGGVEFLIAHANAEMLEIVAKDFAGAFPPVGEHANAGFQVEVEGVDDHAVGASAADAKEVFFLFGLLERGGEAQGDFSYRAANEFFGGA